jgi:hypothetical protein
MWGMNAHLLADRTRFSRVLSSASGSVRGMTHRQTCRVWSDAPEGKSVHRWTAVTALTAVRMHERRPSLPNFTLLSSDPLPATLPGLGPHVQSFCSRSRSFSCWRIFSTTWPTRSLPKSLRVIGAGPAAYGSDNQATMHPRCIPSCKYQLIRVSDRGSKPTVLEAWTETS